MTTVPLSGVSGTTTLTPKTLALVPSDVHLLRVIPMDGNVAAGEASDFSNISEDGIVPEDGGAVTGLSVNSHGTDGLLTSAQVSATGEYLSSVAGCSIR